jgi:hypothetical protein
MSDLAILGKPIIRGKSDIIENYKISTAIPVGSPVKYDIDGSAILSDGTGNLIGVAGYVETDTTVQAVIRKAIDVPVLTDGTDVAIGSLVYITATGLFTGTTIDNTPTGAIFKSGVIQAKNIKTGEIVSNVAIIDFAGGL